MKTILLLLLLLNTAISATSIIAFRTDQYILLGADSRVSWGEHSTPTSTCKIAVIRKVAYAYSGLAQSKAFPNQNVSAFDGYELVREVLDGPGDSLDQKVGTLTERLRPRILAIANATRVTDAKFFYSKMLHDSFAQIAIVSMNGNAPRLLVLNFTLSIQRGNVRVSLKTIDCPKDTGSLYYVPLGEHNAIDNYYSTHKSTVWHPSPEQGILRLLEIQKAATPDTVGEPLSILLLDRKGLRWINTGLCTASAGQ